MVGVIKGSYRHALYTNFFLFQEPNPGVKKVESGTKKIMIRAIKNFARKKKKKKKGV